MPSVEGLSAVQGLIDQSNQSINQGQRLQAAKQAADLFKQGDMKGALMTLAQHDPDHAAAMIQQFQQFDPASQGALHQAQAQGQTQGQYGVTTAYGSNPAQLQELSGNKDIERQKVANQGSKEVALINAAARKQQKATMPTPGEAALDKAFAKEYADFVTKGGYTAVKQNLDMLDRASEQLDKSDTISGGMIGLLPKAVRDIIVPEGAAVQDQIEQVIQSSLRPILGAQFTENEGKRLMERTFNPRMTEAENKTRLVSLFNRIKDAAEEQKKAARYFEDNGTLKGYKGRIITSVDDLMQKDQSGSKKSSPDSLVHVEAVGQKLAPGTQIRQKSTGKILTVQNDGSLN